LPRTRHDAASTPTGGFSTISVWLKLNGHIVEFTRREFELLIYLAHHSGRVVPRTELLSKVWETICDPGSNVIDVYIKMIRHKLGGYAAMLATVRGVGYRMDFSNLSNSELPKPLRRIKGAAPTISQLLDTANAPTMGILTHVVRP
jgi:DNA-binding winged helix-turn-helix (wHTH) protein